MVELQDFLEEFDELASSLANAEHKMLPQLLRRWFAAIDDGPYKISDRTKWLETFLDWTTVEQNCFSTGNSMAGSGTLTWPDKKEERLSAEIQLFRKIANNEIEAWTFAHKYFWVSNGNTNDLVHEFMFQIFVPFSNEFRRYLKQNYELSIAPQSSEREIVPASDRLVTIDHNSRAYTATIQSTDDLKEVINKSNSIENETKIRVLSELDAGKILLEPEKTRLSSVKTVFFVTLTWLTLQFASTAVGSAAQLVLDNLLLLIPKLG